MAGIGLGAQESEKEITVDYNNPKKYVVGGISVEGNKYINSDQILKISGIQPGFEVTVPGEEFSAVVTRLWLQKYFEDVTMVIDSIAPSNDTAFFKIRVVERPRVSRWTFSGVKSGEQKELQERLNLKRGVKVRVTGGEFEGQEGIFLKVKGARDRRVVISIQGVIAVAMVTIHPDLIEPVPVE